MKPTALYGCSCWTLTKAMSDKLRSVRRKMLRKILGARKHPKEDWVEYFSRTTRYMEGFAKELGYESWEFLQRKRTFRFEGRVARCNDGRWSRRLLGWTPWFRTGATFGRNVGRPVATWANDLDKFAGSDWAHTALNQTLWAILEPGYAYKL